MTDSRWWYDLAHCQLRSARTMYAQAAQTRSTRVRSVYERIALNAILRAVTLREHARQVRREAAEAAA